MKKVDFKSPTNIVALLLSIVSFSLFISFFLKNEAQFVHVEYYRDFVKCRMPINEFSFIEWFKSLFNHCYDNGSERFRFYSWFVWYLDIYIRSHVLNYLPFLKTFSIVWFLTIPLIPYFLYKTLNNLLDDKIIAFVGAAIFLTTQANLSIYALFFHSAKPMTLLLLIINLYIASKLSLKLAKKEIIKNKEYFRWGILLSLSLFWDELFYIFFLMTPILFQQLCLRSNEWKRYWSMVGILALFFCITVFVLAPILTPAFHSKEFNFFRAFFVMTDDPVSSLTLKNFLINFQSFVGSHLNFLINQPSYFYPSSENAYHFIFMLIFAILAVTTIVFRKKLHPISLLSFSSLILFVIFQQALLTQTGGILIYGSLYWGLPFSLILIIWLSSLVKSTAQKFRLIALSSLILVSISGYKNTINAVIGHKDASFTTDNIYTDFNFKTPPSFESIAIQEIINLWNSENIEELQSKIKEKNANYMWIYQEFKINKILDN